MLLLQCVFTEMNGIETFHVDADSIKAAPQKNVIYLVRQLSVFIQPFLTLCCTLRVILNYKVWLE